MNYNWKFGDLFTCTSVLPRIENNYSDICKTPAPSPNP
jgi:hypothetical protein